MASVSSFFFPKTSLPAQVSWANNSVNLKKRCTDAKGGFSKDLVNKCVKDVVGACRTAKELRVFADKLGEIITSSDVCTFVGESFNDAVAGAKETFSDKMRPMIQATTSMAIYGRGVFASFINRFFTGLERFLQHIGLIHPLEPAIGNDEVDMKNKKIVSLTALLTSIYATLSPTIGLAAGSIATAGVFLVLLGLGATHSVWRTFPSYLPKTENLTENLCVGRLNIGSSRKELVEKLAQAIINSKWSGLQPMLVGPVGAGKTELIKSLTVAIKKGEYPELKDHRVLQINTPELSQKRDWPSQRQTALGFLNSEIEGYRKESIFVFDKLERATREGAFLADELTRMLDDPEHNFGHVIGVMTDTEYKQQKGSSLVDRFEVIHVDPPQEEESIQILEHSLFKKFPEALVDDDVFSYLYKQTQSIDGLKNKPKKLISVMYRAVQRTSIEQKTEATKKEKQELFQAKNELLSLRNDMSQMAARKDLSEGEKRAFLFLEKQILPAMENSLKEQASAKGIRLWIDQKLIDELLSSS